VATIDTLEYPDAQLQADTEHLRARARQTLRLLGAQELAAFHEFGGSDRLLVASNLGIHEFAYRPSPEDPAANTVGHNLTRWPNVKGVEVALRFPRADSPRYDLHVSVREPNFQASARGTSDATVPTSEFGSVCLAEVERYAGR
jgi:hypothetical protein